MNKVEKKSAADCDKERISAVYNKVPSVGDTHDVFCGGIYDMVSKLAKDFGYRKSGFVQEMVVAGILSTRAFGEEFRKLISRNSSDAASQIRTYVERIERNLVDSKSI